MTTTANDLRYGRRGGGWIPNKRAVEHRQPHLYRAMPCPNVGCAGRIRNDPRTKPTGPYVLGPCDGEFAHTFDVTPLAPHTNEGAPTS